MDANASPVPTLHARVAAPTRPETASAPAEPVKLQATETVAKIEAQSQAQLQSELAPAKLLIEIDKVSGRFVNTLLDPESEQVLRQYPSDAQLAFSRAVEVYLKAMSL
ncbi:MAG TPA: hypothetical protein VG841_02050 [Caulobacterales bacterium]|nr:hypothetical protein [Caulobacterales bacterium]